LRTQGLIPGFLGRILWTISEGLGRIKRFIRPLPIIGSGILAKGRLDLVLTGVIGFWRYLRRAPQKGGKGYYERGVILGLWI